MTFGLGRGAICSAGSHPRHHVQAFRASDLSPFIVVSAVKISITSSLSFYSLASFPASPSLLIILGSTHSHTQTNLHHPPTPRSFLCPSSSNETFSWAMIDLYLLSRPIILGEGISTLSAWSPCQGQIRPGPRQWEEWEKSVFRHPPPPCPIFSLQWIYTLYISITSVSRRHCHYLKFFQNHLRSTYNYANTPVHAQTYTANPFSS